jgi:ribosomal protein S18 acetylase RimI-like enzyme
VGHDIERARGIVVRPTSQADLPGITSGIASRTPEQHRRRLREHERGAGFIELIAWRDGVAVGFVGLGFHDDSSPEELMESRGFAMVTDLHVEVEHRRHGAGRALMLALEESARQARAPGVILDTATSGPFAAARALYRSLGYVDQGGPYLGGWSDPDVPGRHLLDELTIWLKPFGPTKTRERHADEPRG